MTQERYKEQSPKTEAPEDPLPSKKSGGALEFLVVLLVSFALVFGFVKPFVVEAFKIPSESMVPTLVKDDRLFVNKFVYRFTEPERGDVIVFENPEGGEDPLIKRVIALPGDDVQIQGGILFINGLPRKESYVNEAELKAQASYGPTTVPEDHVFVMGDNRANSRDSRFIGPIPYENIEGEAFMLFWPPGRIGLL